MDSQSQHQPLCPDWVFSNNSNVHTAKDRGWFTTYTPIVSKVHSLYIGEEAKVVGIGTVNLRVKKAPGLSGKRSHSTLLLHNVLHVPSFVCNVIGITEDFKPVFSSSGLFDQQGRYIAFFDSRCNLPVIKLSGPPVGPVVGHSVMRKDSGVAWFINARWSDEERRRWETHQQWSEQTRPTSSAEIPYTQAEKAWLKEHYGDEYHFLVNYGLKICNEEDRVEGRAIVRALMKDSYDNDQDSEDGDEDKDEEDEDKKDEEDEDKEDEDKEDEDKEDENELMGHMTDYLFNEAELDFIDQGWKNSMNFMFAYGLKFYDDDDCEEAKQLVKDLMASN
ncbi:hypothetical protein K432DRAFT_434185 [Lepidopterella palustris CBS 459.81]|uniref:Retrovirus-related Pol polyprotein from transposon TNT 1-94-like beta-barrel domain-containing protein n=1 Tax=Lepidopterella palustris CBS 459.81 TaxID=1314670 RepID=A0A8E2ECE1_9PEZI|nr:hypothetical protein K432DRAFT_434185 [Lepidopterella palustris CBS 459.81]